MEPSSHHQFREHAAAFALGALGDEEREEFEAHLLVCDECVDEVRSFARVATVLAYSAPPAAPDLTVRMRVIDGAVGSSGSRMWRAAPWLVAAASLLLAVAVGASAFAVRRNAADAPAIVLILSADDLVRIDLAGQPVAPRSSARAFWSHSRGLIFTASRLPSLPPGRVYQLWIISGQMPIGAGLLKPAADGAVEAVFASPAGLTQAAAFAVTIEPAGGVPAPTGDKYLVGLVK